MTVSRAQKDGGEKRKSEKNVSAEGRKFCVNCCSRGDEIAVSSVSQERMIAAAVLTVLLFASASRGEPDF